MTGTRISLMLAVPSGPDAAEWYKQALGPTRLWTLGAAAAGAEGSAEGIVETPPRRASTGKAASPIRSGTSGTSGTRRRCTGSPRS
jgi:hypothetical protein